MAEIAPQVELNRSEFVLITEHAAEEIRKIKVENKIPESHGLRLGIKGGGCSGMTYVLAFDDMRRNAIQFMRSKDSRCTSIQRASFTYPGLHLILLTGWTRVDSCSTIRMLHGHAVVVIHLVSE